MVNQLEQIITIVMAVICWDMRKTLNPLDFSTLSFKGDSSVPLVNQN
jgi:hypothetical protein